METDSEQFSFVEVALEDGDFDSLNAVSEADVHSQQQRPADQASHEEASDDRPAKRKRNKRSLIWRHYELQDGLSSARCSICKKLQSFEGGSTSNLHRHISKRHPEVFSQLVADRKHPAPAHPTRSSNAKVEVILEDGDTNGILDCPQGGPAGRITREEASEDHPVKRKRNKRSLIWRHYELLESLAAVRCRICMKKLQYFEGGSTSNLHRHMSKRHPEVFSQLEENGQHPAPAHSPQSSGADGDTSPTPETTWTTEKRQFPGLSKVTRAFEGEARVFRRERELIEALRRAQREEAQALEQQRELLERLRAVNAREAAAERREIEALRKAQLEEAKDLSRQREDLLEEKTELQRKWEELHRDREKLVSEQQDS